MHTASVKISAVGDLSVGDHYFSIGHGVGSTIKKYGLRSLLKDLEPIFNCSDISIANLEGVLSSHSCKLDDPVEGYVFRGCKDLAFDLKALGVNVVNVANNHTLQHGIMAWNDTIKSLELAGIAIIGLRSTGDFLSQPAFIHVNGIQIAILGYSGVPEAYFPEMNVYATADQASILRDIKLCRQRADLVVVSIHAGIEGCTLPEYGLVVRCKEIADAGANIVLAHHAHVFHPIENYHGSCIAYGLGNLLFDLPWDPSLVESGITTIDICANGFIESIDITPVIIGQDMAVRKMGGNQKIAFLNRLNKIHRLLEDNEKYQAYFTRKVKLDVDSLEKKKLPYILKNIHKGNTLKKLYFLMQKLVNKVSLGT